MPSAAFETLSPMALANGSHVGNESVGPVPINPVSGIVALTFFCTSTVRWALPDWEARARSKFTTARSGSSTGVAISLYRMSAAASVKSASTASSPYVVSSAVSILMRSLLS